MKRGIEDRFFSSSVISGLICCNLLGEKRRAALNTFKESSSCHFQDAACSSLMQASCMMKHNLVTGFEQQCQKLKIIACKLG